MAGSNLTERIVGVLHDVVEDTDYTFEYLERGKAGGHLKIVAKHTKALEMIEEALKRDS